MKKLILLFCFLLSAFCKGQIPSLKNLRDFTPIPEETQYVQLFKKVIPSKKHDYWELRFSYIDKDTVIFSVPEPPRRLKNKAVYGLSPYDSIMMGGNSFERRMYEQEELRMFNGFFTQCAPLRCYYNILTINNDTVKIADPIRFIGRIDNLEEALLIAALYGYNWDSNDKRGGAYKKTQEGYEFYLMRYQTCPVTYESVKARVKLNGEFSYVNLGAYKKTDDCFTH